jgi:hypothetical protein
MKRLGAVLTVLAVLVVGLGFYRGWFALSRSTPGLGSNKVNVNLMVDPDRIKADTKMVKEKTVEPTTDVTARAK